MNISSPPTLSDYQAALERAVYFQIKDAAYLRLSGDDRKVFLQRQTTNDIELLSPSRSIVTVLTSPSARIIEVLRLIEHENHISIIPLPGRAKATSDYLESKIFFMDKVNIEDVSHEYSQFIVDGPKSIKILQKIGIRPLPEKDEIFSLIVDKLSITIIGDSGLGTPSRFQILVPAEREKQLASTLEDFGVKQLSEETHEILRVEAGMPKLGHELTDKYTPLETNLAHVISNSKGCYTGQEVIARQINNDKITKQLSKVKLGGKVKTGAALLIDGKKVGELTSSVISPRFGQIGLAIIKRPHFISGTQFTVMNNENNVSGNVVADF